MRELINVIRAQVNSMIYEDKKARKILLCEDFTGIFCVIKEGSMENGVHVRVKVTALQKSY